jgi:hypothetical protein
MKLVPPPLPFIFLQYVSAFMPLSLWIILILTVFTNYILTLHIGLKYTINFQAGALSIVNTCMWG